MTIELTTAALFLFSTFYGGLPAQAGALANVKESKTGTMNVRASQTALADQPLTLEAYVREYFKDMPILAEIARCESEFRHLGASGQVLRGEVAVEDVGVMQINEFYHGDRAKAFGLDLHTLDGNLAYAKWLYTKEGTTPWYSSSKCWERSDTLARTYEKLTVN